MHLKAGTDNNCCAQSLNSIWPYQAAWPMNHLEFIWRGAEQPKMQLSSHSLASWHLLLLTPKVHLPQISFLSPGIQKVPPLSFPFLSQGISPGQAHLASHMHCGQRSLWRGWAELFWTSSYWRKTNARLGLSKYLSYTTYTAVPVAWLGRWLDLFRWAEQICALPSVVTSWPATCIAFGCLFSSKIHSAFSKWFSHVLK